MSPGNWGELQRGAHAETGARDLGFGKQASGGLHEEVHIEGVPKHANRIYIYIYTQIMHECVFSCV